MTINRSYTVKDRHITLLFCRKYLDDFCSYQLNAMQNSGLFWDHALLLTGHDLYSDYPRIDRGSSGSTQVFKIVFIF